MTNAILFTSRYNCRALKDSGLIAVGTSLGAPKFDTGFPIPERIRELMPTGNMLRMSREVYEPKYYEILEKVGVDRLREIFNGISERYDGKGLALLCFENVLSGKQWCHRRMFAAWWEEKTGERVPEYEQVNMPPVGEKSPTPPKEDPPQLALEFTFG